jgi:hypothetical protein
VKTLFKTSIGLLSWAQVPPENGYRIQSPKGFVLIRERTIDNVQNCDSYIKQTFMFPLEISSHKHRIQNKRYLS